MSGSVSKTLRHKNRQTWQHIVSCSHTAIPAQRHLSMNWKRSEFEILTLFPLDHGTLLCWLCRTGHDTNRRRRSGTPCQCAGHGCRPAIRHGKLHQPRASNGHAGTCQARSCRFSRCRTSCRNSAGRASCTCCHKRFGRRRRFTIPQASIFALVRVPDPAPHHCGLLGQTARRYARLGRRAALQSGVE